MNHIESVTNRLERTDAAWKQAPDYQYFNRDHMHRKVSQIHESILAEGYENQSEVEKALEDTIGFVDRAFDLYEGVTKPDEDIGRVFAVPVRTERNDERYESEVFPFVPLYKSKFGVNANIRQRALVGLPPTILDTYTASYDQSLRGAVVLTPLFSDMANDIMPGGMPEEGERLYKIITENINETARFSQQVLGAKVMGLGAILPALTNFGATINQEGLTTTTGHAGTVHLIVETARKVIQELNMPPNAKLGVIGGAGSIGYSSIDAVVDMLPDYEVLTYDKNEERLGKLVAFHPKTDQIHTRNSSIEVIAQSDIVITAVTGKIDLDAEDPNYELDLSGKYIIDDSQPGCFQQEQVERRGGKLLWVVGKDGSEEKFITRDNGYNFGDEAGIMGESAIWGCEAEAGVIAASKEYGKALRERVEPRHVRVIGELCARYNVQIADYQAYGRPVHLS